MQKVKEKRRYERYSFPRAVKYILIPDNNGRVFDGFAVNISDCGLCISTPYILGKGQELTIKTKLPVSNQTGVVCWIKKFDDNLCKVGLMLCNSAV